MKIHSTNYKNTFIEVADDCKADQGIIPPEKTKKTIAKMQFDMLNTNPYKYTSDEVIFSIYAQRKAGKIDNLEQERKAFFSKGQPCLRSSPLGKTYGWGIHFDSQSRVAIYAKGSQEYTKFKNDKTLKQLKAMKSKR
jgi:hypothetical protein